MAHNSRLPDPQGKTVKPASSRKHLERHIQIAGTSLSLFIPTVYKKLFTGTRLMSGHNGNN